MKFHNIFTNFALIHKRTLPLQFYGKTALYNIIATYLVRKLQILHPTYSSILPLLWNMIIFSPTSLLSTNGLRCCISMAKLPYITLSLHTFHVNYKYYTLRTFHPQLILPLSWNMIIFSLNLLLSTNGLNHCISMVKLPYITLSLHTFYVNCKC